MNHITFEDDLELSEVLTDEELTKSEEIVDDMPEETVMLLRIATYEAVIEDTIEDAIREAGGNVNDDIVVEAVHEAEDMLAKAIALSLIPSSLRNRVQELLASYRKRQDPLLKLSAKVSNRMVSSLTRIKMEADLDKVADGVEDGYGHKVDDCETDDIDKSDTKKITTDRKIDIIDPEEDVESVATTPKEIDDAVKTLCASHQNTKKAYASLNAKCTQYLVKDTLHTLRNHLPKSIKKKYGI